MQLFNQNLSFMNKNIRITSLVFSALVLFVVMSLAFSACKKKNDKKAEDPWEEPYSPQPTPEFGVPDSILPAALIDTVKHYMNIYSGDNPPQFGEIQCLSHPHKLIFSTQANDSIGEDFSDRYIAFQIRNKTYVDFYGKQWDDNYNAYYEEAYRKLVLLGTGENFSCYYLTEGYPNGLYACYSTIFSGKWTSSYNGIKDFQVAVILLETSGNPYLAPKNTFRVLGDGDGLAEYNQWMDKAESFDNTKMTDEDLFRMFRVK